MRFTRAIVRRPASTFAGGISSAVGGGFPDVVLARAQHERYCEALRQCGLDLTTLPADDLHPDSTFVEDTAVLTSCGAILARPGAPSRMTEASAMLESLHGFFSAVTRIKSPGTLDGGDVCEADGDFLIGLSARTNEEGARQLAAYLSQLGHTSTIVDIRNCPRLLHLKTGLSYLGEGAFIVAAEPTLTRALDRYELLTIPPGEEYAANCLHLNDHVLIAAGYPRFLAMLTARGNNVIAIDMSEFRKMDGGLSCLSLRF
jgi:dimethylargininase